MASWMVNGGNRGPSVQLFQRDLWLERIGVRFRLWELDLNTGDFAAHNIQDEHSLLGP
jgi:hypothetical protein